MKNLLILMVCAFVVAYAGKAYFWQATDIHLQFSYKEGTNDDNDCHSGSGDAGKYGTYGLCDTPQATVESMAEFIKSKSDELGIAPNFVLWTGDIMSDSESDKSKDGLKKHFTYWTGLLKDIEKHFKGKTRILPTLGNHDAAPQHQFSEDSNHFSVNETYHLWKDFLDKEALETLKKGGYYSHLVIPGVRVLGINTAMYFVANSQMDVDESRDPLGQFEWLKKTLQQCRDNNEKVIISSHIAPGRAAEGDGAMWKAWSNKMVKTMSGYNDIIIAGFYGHNHCEAYRIVRDVNEGQNGASIHYLSGSGTPAGGHNPIVSLLEFSTEPPYTLLDRTVYYFNLKNANRDGKVKWETMYQTTKEYGIKDMSTESMISLIDKFADMNSDEWDKYEKHLYQDVDHGHMDRGEHDTRICAMKYALTTDYDNC